jgi:hypothetical protein
LFEERKNGSKGQYLSASQIAQLGFCERFVALEARKERDDHPDIKRRRAEGVASHERYFGESVSIAKRQRQARRGTCFVAGRVFEPESNGVATLRRFRNEVLVRSVLGRWLVSAYDRSCPLLVMGWDRAPIWARGWARTTLETVARMVGVRLAKDATEVR